VTGTLSAATDQADTIELSGTSDASLYSDVNCTSNISTLSVPSGTTSFKAYFKDLVVESLNLQFSLGSSSTSASVIVSNTLFRLTVNNPGIPCPPVTIDVLDASENPVSVSATASLSGTISGSLCAPASNPRPLGFYSDSGCHNSVEQATFSNSSSAVVYTEGQFCTDGASGAITATDPSHQILSGSATYRLIQQP
jgi:hypothetical protein